MIRYVCGFLFDTTLNLVVLIEKQTPAWQKGRWNGVGGKIEDGETPIQAMTREFKEEAGMEITDWKQYCTLGDPNFEVCFFHSVVDPDQITKVRTLTAEQLGIWSIPRVSMWNFPILSNLRWLLPMALVAIKNENPEFYNINIT